MLHDRNSLECGKNHFSLHAEMLWDMALFILIWDMALFILIWDTWWGWSLMALFILIWDTWWGWSSMALSILIWDTWWGWSSLISINDLRIASSWVLNENFNLINLSVLFQLLKVINLDKKVSLRGRWIHHLIEIRQECASFLTTS